MKLGDEAPGTVIDVSRLGLDGVDHLPDGGLRIGAAVRNSDLAAHDAVRRRYPALALALLSGASGQLRNMATVGGNLLQRARCSYFQDVTKPCNKRAPGSGCPAIDGEHRMLAILGTSPHCIATNPSDMCVALVMLDASVAYETADGRLEMPVRELHRLPGEHPEQDTDLPPGALVLAVDLPPPPPGPSTYRKVRDRASFAFALVSVAASLALDAGGTVAAVRLALGGVATVPWRAARFEAELGGRPFTGAAVAQAIDAELDAARPLRDNAFKVPLARNVIGRVMADLAAVDDGGAGTGSRDGQR
jgi:xanthine dehydrogenase YagS FAD-binding subunit